MAIESIDDRAFMQSGAKTVLIGRLMREVAMLRRHIGANPIGDFACPICFRTMPHSTDLHDRDNEYLRTIDKDELAKLGR